jgi:hypothetical protein
MTTNRKRINPLPEDFRSALVALLLYEAKMDTIGKIQYSPMEKQILDAIPVDGRYISTLELVDIIYKKPPKNARQSIVTVANSLISKSDENMEPWEIFKSKQKGSQPSYFWRKARE